MAKLRSRTTKRTPVNLPLKEHARLIKIANKKRMGLYQTVVSLMDYYQQNEAAKEQQLRNIDAGMPQNGKEE